MLQVVEWKRPIQPPRSFKRNCEVTQTWFRGGLNVIPSCLKRNSELGDSKAIPRWLKTIPRWLGRHLRGDSKAIPRWLECNSEGISSVSFDSLWQKTRVYIQTHACSGQREMTSVIKQLTGGTRHVTSRQVIATSLAIRVIQTLFRGDSNVIPRWLKRNSELNQKQFRARWLEDDSEVIQKQFQGDSNAVLEGFTRLSFR